jgi:hypothetical protein
MERIVKLNEKNLRIELIFGDLINSKRFIDAYRKTY